MDKKLAYQFDKIYKSYSTSIYRFVYIKVSSQETAEDLTSEVFVRFWKTFQKSGQDRILNPKAFLYKMAKNVIVDFYRKQTQPLPLPIDEVVEIADSSQDISKRELALSDQEQIQKAIKNLKDDDQDVILWYYLDQMPVGEIAEIVDKSENAVRVMIHRAMQELREQLPKM